MNEEYIGKVCPYCKTEFKEGDDIVICSICEMPHHKDCWIENGGCTTFGCLGTIQNPDGSVPNSVTSDTMQYDNATTQETIQCPYCGTVNYSNATNCYSCHKPLNTAYQQNITPNAYNYQNQNNAYNQQQQYVNYNNSTYANSQYQNNAYNQQQQYANYNNGAYANNQYHNNAYNQQQQYTNYNNNSYANAQYQTNQQENNNVPEFDIELQSDVKDTTANTTNNT